MSTTRHAVELGARRGLIELGQSLRSAQDLGFSLFMAVAILGYLLIRRDDTVPGTDLLVPSVQLPSILAALVAFGLVIGPAYALAMQREDGTLLRFKAMPHGVRAYFTSQLVAFSGGVLPQVVVVLVPSLLLFDDVMPDGASGWLMMAGMLLLGTLAIMPLGIIIGAVVPSTQKVGTWGMLPIAVLTGISGIFFPLAQLWGWVQAIAQVFPLYWFGLGMRSAFLPDQAAAAELGGSWQTPQTLAILAAWAVVGWIVTPIVLRRMARRQSGSDVEAAREAALQWVR
jgi:ABC-2 type transport system permease protein